MGNNFATSAPSPRTNTTTPPAPRAPAPHRRNRSCTATRLRQTLIRLLATDSALCPTPRSRSPSPSAPVKLTRPQRACPTCRPRAVKKHQQQPHYARQQHRAAPSHPTAPSQPRRITLAGARRHTPARASRHPGANRGSATRPQQPQRAEITDSEGESSEHTKETIATADRQRLRKEQPVVSGSLCARFFAFSVGNPPFFCCFDIMCDFGNSGGDGATVDGRASSGSSAAAGIGYPGHPRSHQRQSTTSAVPPRHPNAHKPALSTTHFGIPYAGDYVVVMR